MHRLPEMQDLVFWVMTLCIDVVGYQRFGGSCWWWPRLEFSSPWKSQVFPVIPLKLSSLFIHRLHYAPYFISTAITCFC